MKGQVRLSQCMIVKNEEKNIRQALSWAKGIAFEQIVIDTGSTDGTVAIAEEMGAKIFYFPWTDDFSAAKNFAIEKATGNWIAFLDADEYFTEKDAKHLFSILKQVEQKMNAKSKPHIIRCKWLHLNNQGIPFSVDIQDRIFRNMPALRYRNRIHEVLSLPKGYELKAAFYQNELSILHTGYMQETCQNKQKAARNIRLLGEELKENPQNYDALSYLGDSLLMADQKQEAMECYRRVLQEEPPLDFLTQSRFNSAGYKLLNLLVTCGKGKKEELFFTAEKLGYPDNPHPDIHYYIGYWMLQKEEYSLAKEELEISLQKMEKYQGNDTLNSMANLECIYVWLADACEKLGRKADEVRYIVLTLRINPWQENPLTVLLSILMKELGEAENGDGTWKLLSGLYHLDQEKDRLFVLKIAMIVGFKALEERLK